MRTPTKCDLAAFYSFSKLGRTEQSKLLQREGHLLDTDVLEKENVNLYYINGFFVEETRFHSNSAPSEIIPYKKGFRKQSKLYSTTGLRTQNGPTAIQKKCNNFKKLSNCA